MQTHYIPRLLLRHFATGKRINTYDFAADAFCTKNIKNTFAGQDLFPTELEKMMATKLEAPFGNLLNNKLLTEKSMCINRQENLLIRKFILIHFLRAPIVNTTWEEMVKRTRTENHSSVKAREYLVKNLPEYETIFKKEMPSKDTYFPDLKQALEIDSMEELAGLKVRKDISESLRLAALQAMVTGIAFWDCEDCEQEFILPKLPGISEMDGISIFHKMMVLMEKEKEIHVPGIPKEVELEFMRLLYNTPYMCENYSIYPISQTRALVFFSPYFRGFFPIQMRPDYPPILEKEQFARHFYKAPRIELFQPCISYDNLAYQYRVKQLTREETLRLNALMLQMETEEFAFHDYNKIRDSFRYYATQAKFIEPKKHDFSHLL